MLKAGPNTDSKIVRLKLSTLRPHRLRLSRLCLRLG